MTPVEDAPALPATFLEVFGASADQLRQVAEQSHVIVCQAVFGPGWPPAHEWYARGVAAERHAEVRLRLDPPDRFDGQAFLTVLPPAAYGRSGGECLASVSAALFGEPASAVRRAPRDARINAAIAAARAALPEARARFLGGTVAASSLIVKHGLAGHGTQREYVWSTVTAWPDPSRIHGVSMSGAETDPAVRAGRPTSIDAATVVDWGVRVDGRGIIEGGWTNRLLS